MFIFQTTPSMPENISKEFQGTIWLDKLLQVRVSNPHPILLQQRENLFICNAVHVVYDDELFPILHELSNVQSCHRKWGVRHYHIALLEQLNALWRPKISILSQLSPHPGLHIGIIPAGVFQLISGLFRIIVGCDELLESDVGEIQVEIPPEV